jgi:hypothetical protein
MPLGSASVDGGSMEIRVVLDQVEPPSGRLQVLSVSRRETGLGGGHGPEALVEFTGWLGLIRALEEVTGQGRTGTPGMR